MAPPPDDDDLLDDDDDDSGAGQATLLRVSHDFTPAQRVTVRLQPEGAGVAEPAPLELEPGARRLVGSSASCDVVVADRSVSRRHASVELVGGRVQLLDLGSTNGTRVDGVSVLGANLQGGERLELGEVRLRVLISERREVALGSGSHFGGLIGASTEVRRLYPLLERLARSEVPVVIEGETGTGKEVLAEAIHRQGPRADRPFVVLDCTAVPANLLESELFGHEKGAFTGALATRPGVLEQAEGGTLFVDEIGDLSADLQPKLLRVLERGEFRRLGSNTLRRTRFRLLSATRRDLDREVQAGRFRDDLFHRLSVVRVELPPLRRRRGDVRLLVQHFCEQLGGDMGLFPAALLRQWDEAPWPGNVRELRNAVARRIAVGDLADRRAPPAPSAPAAPTSTAAALEALLASPQPWSEVRAQGLALLERAYVHAALARHGGNVTRAAEAAGVALRYFQALRARHGGG